jgi:hypothetical protein
MTTDIEIKQADKKFSEMIKDIFEAYRLGVKCGIQINLSGSLSEFNYKYTNIDSEGIQKLIKGIKDKG